MRNQIHFDEGDAGGVVGIGDVDAVGAGLELEEEGGVFAGVGECGEADLGGGGGEKGRGGGGAPVVVAHDRSGAAIEPELGVGEAVAYAASSERGAEGAEEDFGGSVAGESEADDADGFASADLEADGGGGETGSVFVAGVVDFGEDDA